MFFCVFVADVFAPAAIVDAHSFASVVVVVVVVVLLQLLVIYGGAFAYRGFPPKARNFSDYNSIGFLSLLPRSLLLL